MYNIRLFFHLCKPFVESHIIICDTSARVQHEQCQVCIDESVAGLLEHILNHGPIETSLPQMCIIEPLCALEARSIYKANRNVKEVGCDAFTTISSQARRPIDQCDLLAQQSIE